MEMLRVTATCSGKQYNRNSLSMIVGPERNDAHLPIFKIEIRTNAEKEILKE